MTHPAILLALALVQPAPSQAPAPAPPAAQVFPVKLPPAAFTSGPIRADASKLARLIIPEDLYLATLERGVMAGVDAVEEELADVDPKVLEAFRKEVPALIREHERGNLPRSYDRFARAIGSHFTPAEVSELSAFYESRTGQKIIVGKFAGVDMSGLVEKFVEDPDAELTASDITEMNRSAVGKLVKHLDAKDTLALLAFMTKPAFARLRAFGPTMTALEAQMASEPDPELDAKIEAATMDILARFGVGAETS